MLSDIILRNNSDIGKTHDYVHFGYIYSVIRFLYFNKKS